MQIKIDRQGAAKICLTKQETETLRKAQKLCSRVAMNEQGDRAEAARETDIGLQAVIGFLDIQDDKLK